MTSLLEHLYTVFENQPKSLITNCWKFWSIIPDSVEFTQVERQFNYCMDDHNFQVPLMKQNWIESAFNKLFPSHITEMTSRETEKKHCGTFSTIGSRVLYMYHEKPFFGGVCLGLGDWGKQLSDTPSCIFSPQGIFDTQCTSDSKKSTREFYTMCGKSR